MRSVSKALPLLGLLCLAVHPVTSVAQTFSWTGDAGDSLWLRPGNWDVSGVPDSPGESAIVGAPSPTDLDGLVEIDALNVTSLGRLTLAPGAVLDLADDPSGQLTNNGLISLADGSSLTFLNSVSNTGEIEVASTGEQTTIDLRRNVFLSGGGTLRLQGSGAAVTTTRPGGRTLINRNHTIEGEGMLGGALIFIDNEAGGLINANVAGATLEIDSRSGGSAFDLMNLGGTLQASGGGTLLLSDELGFDGIGNDDGVIQALAGSEVQLSVADISGGTVRSTGNGVVRVLRSTTIFGSASAVLREVNLEGSIVVDPGAVVEISGTTTNEGVVRVMSGNVGEPTIVNAIADANFTGSGSLILGSPGTSDSAGVQLDGERIFNRGEHTIRGSGVINADLNNQATLFADSPGGPLTVAGPLTLTPVGTLAVLLDGDGFADSGQFQIDTPLTLDGTLRLVVGSGFDATVGDTYVFLNSSSDITETFFAVDQSRTGGFQFDVIYTDDSVAVQLVAVPEPTTAAILAVGVIGLFRRTRGIEGPDPT